MAKHKIATDVELWQHFEVNAISIVETSLRKRAIVWHDSFEAGAMLPKSAILDVWQLGNMHDSVFRAIDAGHDIVFSACWYLDAMDRDWWAFYSCDPRKLNYQHSIDTGRLTGEQKARILGGHSCMWGEVVDATNFFERVWPRASATAEVLWAGGAIEEEGTQDAVKSRLERFRCWMVQQFDIPASPISPGHCEMRPNVYTSGSSLF
jgi:hexosaminidase